MKKVNLKNDLQKDSKTFKVQDYIGIFDNYFSDEVCDKYIRYFDKFMLLDRNTLKYVQDKHYSLLANLFNNDLNINDVGTDFHRIFWSECYPKYTEKYPIIKEFQKHRILDMKIQITEKGQGYHKWHCEMMDSTSHNRFLVFSLYLNTIKKGGETEFLNQSLRVEAVKNRFVMFPASYTHVHRGNPPLSGTKYILTGWVEFGE
tara:strand:- start:50 stop:658 length:609 start_codon:yes stop_codon:yes gene_type:complete